VVGGHRADIRGEGRPSRVGQLVRMDLRPESPDDRSLEDSARLLRREIPRSTKTSQKDAARAEATASKPSDTIAST